MNLLQMSLQAGLLIAAIVVVRAVALNRLPKTTFLILWGIALFRMLVPFSFSSKWSLYRFLNSGTSTNVLSPNAISGAVRETAQAEGDAIQHSRLFMIWFGVMLLLAVLLSLWLFLNYRHLRFSMLIKDNKLIEEWAAIHKLRRPLKIMRTDRITAPLSVGIVRPRIILPKAMDLEKRKLVHYVLTREYFHIRRFDMVWKLLTLCAACIHWFNPMAWIMLLLVNRDLEITCDEMVCRHFGGNINEQKSYAYSLISMAELRSGYVPIYSYFSKNALEERITAIMKSKKMTSGGIIIAAMIIVFAATAFTLSPADAGETREEPQVNMVEETPPPQLVYMSPADSGEMREEPIIDMVEETSAPQPFYSE